MRHIYFAGDRDDPEYVKIGVSDNPLKRLRQLQTARPGMYLIETMPGTASDEEWTRKRFSKWHVAKETFRGIPHQTIREFAEIARRFWAQGVPLTQQMTFAFMTEEAA